MAFKLLETFREILNGHKDELGKQKIYLCNIGNQQTKTNGRAVH